MMVVAGAILAFAWFEHAFRKDVGLPYRPDETLGLYAYVGGALVAAGIGVVAWRRGARGDASQSWLPRANQAVTAAVPFLLVFGGFAGNYVFEQASKPALLSLAADAERRCIIAEIEPTPTCRVLADTCRHDLMNTRRFDDAGLRDRAIADCTRTAWVNSEAGVAE